MSRVLARTPRFSGHTEGGAYSVAQHCVEGAYAILRDTGRRDIAAAFLLHDGHEYVIGDIATPLAGALGHYADVAGGISYDGAAIVAGAIKALKHAVDAAIYAAAGIKFPLPADVAAMVRSYDLRMMRTERDARLATPPMPWVAAVECAEPVVGCNLSRWSEEFADWRFHDALGDLCGLAGSHFG